MKKTKTVNVKDNEGNSAKPWSEEENRLLFELIRQYGVDYRKICEYMQRSDQGVRSRIERVCWKPELIDEEFTDVKETLLKLSWTMDDYEKLIKALENCIDEQEKEIDPSEVD